MSVPFCGARAFGGRPDNGDLDWRRYKSKIRAAPDECGVNQNNQAQAVMKIINLRHGLVRTLPLQLIALTLIFITTSNAANVTVGYWQFTNSSNLGIDSSGLGNTLTTASGSPTYSSAGKFGGALY